jgi:hypothetical protein
MLVSVLVDKLSQTNDVQQIDINKIKHNLLQIMNYVFEATDINSFSNMDINQANMILNKKSLDISLDYNKNIDNRIVEDTKQNFSKNVTEDFNKLFEERKQLQNKKPDSIPNFSGISQKEETTSFLPGHNEVTNNISFLNSSNSDSMQTFSETLNTFNNLNKDINKNNLSFEEKMKTVLANREAEFQNSLGNNKMQIQDNTFIPNSSSNEKKNKSDDINNLYSKTDNVIGNIPSSSNQDNDMNNNFTNNLENISNIIKPQPIIDIKTEKFVKSIIHSSISSTDRPSSNTNNINNNNPFNFAINTTESFNLSIKHIVSIRVSSVTIKIPKTLDLEDTVLLLSIPELNTSKIIGTNNNLRNTVAVLYFDKSIDTSSQKSIRFENKDNYELNFNKNELVTLPNTLRISLKNSKGNILYESHVHNDEQQWATNADSAISNAIQPPEECELAQSYDFYKKECTDTLSKENYDAKQNILKNAKNNQIELRKEQIFSALINIQFTVEKPTN